MHPLKINNSMKGEKNSVVTLGPPEEKKQWPAGITLAFLIVITASFMPWGTIQHHYTWQFMAYMEHPGLCNRIAADVNLSGIKRGAELNHTGSAWKSGFDIMGLYYPHWVLTVVAVFLFGSTVFGFFEYVYINPSILQLLSFYGIIHVVASALGFFSQGTIGWGLILTGFGYFLFMVCFLCAKY